jgi:hypothetical membrane protein
MYLTLIFSVLVYCLLWGSKDKISSSVLEIITIKLIAIFIFSGTARVLL